MPIRVLPPEVAARIAAGEVVQRPASVVKELVENALDAAARRIRVEIRDGGRQEIRVVDDGVGIPADQVLLAFERHATSKIADEADLWAIQTLGFRGEALPSIAAVSHLTLRTRAEGEDLGTEVVLEGGKVAAHRPVGAPRGTTVIVRNLFFNTPARRKFLKSRATEGAWIARVVQSYALARPDVAFTLVREGRTALETPGKDDLLLAAAAVLGQETAASLVPVLAERPDGEGGVIRVRGLVSLPGQVRRSRDQIYLFVNGRWVQDAFLLKALEEAYRGLIARGEHPIALLFLELDPALVDVNVHPAKAEVRFRRPSPVFGAVQGGVRAALRGDVSPLFQAPLPRVEGPSEGLRETPPPHPEGEPLRPVRDAPPPAPVDASAEAPLPPRPPEPPPPSPPRGGGVGTPPPPEAAPTTLPGLEPREAGLPPLRILGQLDRTFIVAEGPDGLYLIDQHAAHERIRYDELIAARRGTPARQELLMPVTVDLAPSQAAVLEERAEELGRLGFELEPFGPGQMRVRAVPAGLEGGKLEAALREVADVFLGEGAEWDPGNFLGLPPWEHRLLATLACHSSVRAGRTLSREEMEALVEALAKTAFPRTCPHGRPTLTVLNRRQLERTFGRHR